MNIGNITSDNFNLDGNGKDIQIEVYEQIIEQLQQKNKQLKEHIKKYEHYCKTTGIEELMKKNKKYKEVIDKLSSQIKLYGKYNGEKCTRGFSMMAADFNKLLDILKEVNK